jgi:coproporphyrinogen III oxidase-like Fe-S oxidoreductase
MPHGKKSTARAYMQRSEKLNPAFKINSDADSGLLGLLTSCEPNALFSGSQNTSPVALNLHFQKGFNASYLELLTKEISIYADKVGTRKALKTWFRGAPFSSLSAAEITELTFLAATHFQMDEESFSEYGFECTLEDINDSNLALMKGLRFTSLLLNLNTTLAPQPTAIDPTFESIKQYRFQEVQCRLNAATSNWSHLSEWLHSLVSYQPSLIEITGLEKNTNDAIRLDLITKNMSKYGYILLGNRFFVMANHPLARLKKQRKLQYTPTWGASHSSIKDWIGIGIGAVGRISNTFYQNLPVEAEYAANLSDGKLPICCSGEYPSPDATHTWGLIEQLICLHQISLTDNNTTPLHFEKIQGILKNACQNGWMTKKGSDFIIKDQGLNHIREICNQLQHC